MDITPWIEKLTKEGAVIYDAPFVFGFSLLFACLVIWYVVRLYYSENLKMKDDLISTFRDKLAFAEKAVQALHTGEPLSTGEEPKSLSAGEIFPEGIEFFATIDDLRAGHPLRETFKQGNELHAYLLSGEGVFEEYTDYIKCVKRLILPKPDAAYLAIMRTLPNSYADFRTKIITTRALAMKNNVPVRLFDDFTGVSILFCNPDRSDGWVQLGLIIPCSESRERPHIRLYKASNEEAVKSLYKTFDLLWENSSKNTEEEDMQEGFDGVTK
jgi:hypothetical protein